MSGRLKIGINDIRSGMARARPPTPYNSSAFFRDCQDLGEVTPVSHVPKTAVPLHRLSGQKPGNSGYKAETRLSVSVTY
jgi:hypothetical protein